MRNMKKSITIYNNEFKKVLADTGTGFLIHNLEDPESKKFGIQSI